MILLIGPSASGKTIVSKELTKHNISKVITYTTRKIRENEINGIDYHFLGKADFEKKITENFFLEYVTYNDNYYGTAKDSIKKNVSLIIEPKGLQSIKRITDDFVSFYFYADQDCLKLRMQKRNDNLSDISKRLENDRIAFNLNEIKPDFIINTSNSNIEECVQFILDKYKKHYKQQKNDR